MAKQTAQERWCDMVDELGVELIDLPEYPPESERLTMRILQTGIVPDWSYENEILFICQLRLNQN